MLNQKLVIAESVSPLYDKVLVKPDAGELRSPSGMIIIPETAYKRSESGTVMAVGEGRLTPDGLLIELSVSPGDHVLFSRHRAAEIELSSGGEVLLVLPEEDIYAVLGKKKSGLEEEVDQMIQEIEEEPEPPWAHKHPLDRPQAPPRAWSGTVVQLDDQKEAAA